MQVVVRCPNCMESILADDCKEANICPKCNEAYITDKAIKAYNENTSNDTPEKRVKKRHALRSLGRGLLMVIECIGYLFYCIFLVWLFVDITDNLRKK